nr:MAG TPA: hypothetical protein [Caudoviricetes sp.]
MFTQFSYFIGKSAHIRYSFHSDIVLSDAIIATLR